MENWEKVLEELFTGVMGMSDPTVWVMFAIGAVLIWLGVKKDYEPMLLFPMGVGCILANIPGHFAVIPTDGGEPGFLSVLYQAGIANELFPVLIFIAVGAMCADPCAVCHALCRSGSFRYFCSDDAGVCRRISF